MGINYIINDWPKYFVAGIFPFRQLSLLRGATVSTSKINKYMYCIYIIYTYIYMMWIREVGTSFFSPHIRDPRRTWEPLFFTMTGWMTGWNSWVATGATTPTSPQESCRVHQQSKFSYIFMFFFSYMENTQVQFGTGLLACPHINSSKIVAGTNQFKMNDDSRPEKGVV